MTRRTKSQEQSEFGGSIQQMQERSHRSRETYADGKTEESRRKMMMKRLSR